jgi:hypothetical protein
LKTGDVVLHKPSGETWVVAIVDGDDLMWCGWPPGMARTSDCELVESCSDEESLDMLKKVAEIRGDSGYDRRAMLAKRRLESMGVTV